MNPQENFFEKVSDWINPIVVKEMRQAVQSKFVAGVLILLLVVQLFAIGIFLLSSGDQDFEGGQTIFMVLQGFLLGFCMLFIPTYAGIRFFSERSDTNVDLLYITTIRPSAIIWGKYLAALLITLLIYSACMPFMTFTYFLRGVDLPTIFVLLVFGFTIVAMLTQVAIFIACIPTNKLFRVFLAVGQLIITFIGFFSVMGFSFEMLRFGIGSRLGSWEFWAGSLTYLIVCFSVIGLLLVLSVAIITPSTANRAFPVRLFLVVAWGITGVTCIAMTHLIGNFGAIISWIILNVTIFSLAFLAAVSEREELGRRVTRSIPRNPLLRLPAFFLFSGAASGVAWSVVMIGLTLGAAISVANLFSFSASAQIDLQDVIERLAGTALYAFCYAMTASLIRRTIFPNKIKPETTWAVAVVLMLLGTVVPSLIAFFSFSKVNEAYWFFGNPFALTLGVAALYRTFYFFIVCGWAVVMTIVSIPWFFQQVKGFKPPALRSESGFPTSALPG